jgi:hypothetical protein
MSTEREAPDNLPKLTSDEPSMKRTIYIDRPNGRIPGLLEVNALLAARFGVTVAAVIDTDDNEQPLWVGCELREARIENDEIIVGDVNSWVEEDDKQSDAEEGWMQPQYDARCRRYE